MSEVKKLVLYGAGGMGREVAEIVEAINAVELRFDLLGFIDDADFSAGSMVGDYPCLGKRDWLLAHKDEVWCTCTVGFPKTRQNIQTALAEDGVRIASLIAPDVHIGQRTSVGTGCVIYPNVRISCDCEVGNGVLINSRNGLGHDVTIGDFTVISPACGISGGCKIGSAVNVGGHAFLIPQRKVGNDAVIAAGSVVFGNVRAGTTVLGNPAKRMRALEK